MNSIRKTRRSGFTLVEILIVVIILGILAAIVIPQFTNASEDARHSSVTSQLQTIRSQMELYKLQHLDNYPTNDGTLETDWNWAQMTTKTTEKGDGEGDFGPYLQGNPVNAITNGFRVVSKMDDAEALAATPDLTGTDAATRDGYVLSKSTGKIWAFDRGNVNPE